VHWCGLGDGMLGNNDVLTERRSGRIAWPTLMLPKVACLSIEDDEP
jgi:hypothetical protein